MATNKRQTRSDVAEMYMSRTPEDDEAVSLLQGIGLRILPLFMATQAYPELHFGAGVFRGIDQIRGFVEVYKKDFDDEGAEMTYKFMADGEISKEDIERIIELTSNDLLIWKKENYMYRFSAFPADSDNIDKIIGDNICGIRMGYDPFTNDWQYLRLIPRGDEKPRSPEPRQQLIQLADRLYKLICSKTEQQSIEAQDSVKEI
ncbi:MAG: hypothetical protein Q8P54_01325 [bacterium]|nr:hypothetical protein [bacterium]